MTLGLVIGGMRSILKAEARTSSRDGIMGENSSILGRISSGWGEECGECLIGTFNFIIDRSTPLPLACADSTADPVAGRESRSLMSVGEELGLEAVADDSRGTTGVDDEPFWFSFFELDGMMPPETTSKGGLGVAH